MSKDVGWAGSVSAIEPKLKQSGMKNMSPEPPKDRTSGGSVNSETTRSETSRGHSITGRTA